jgi:hypothetical protein
MSDARYGILPYNLRLSETRQARARAAGTWLKCANPGCHRMLNRRPGVTEYCCTTCANAVLTSLRKGQDGAA